MLAGQSARQTSPHHLRRALRGWVFMIWRGRCAVVPNRDTSRTPDPYRIERIARAIRRGVYSHVSLESALSEYGAISQIPVNRLAVMTTVRKGVYPTPYGTIEFTHTSRPIIEVLQRRRISDGLS